MKPQFTMAGFHRTTKIELDRLEVVERDNGTRYITSQLRITARAAGDGQQDTEFIFHVFSEETPADYTSLTTPELNIDPSWDPILKLGTSRLQQMQRTEDAPDERDDDRR